MSENSLFAILLRSPWWISFAVAAVLVLAAKMTLPPQYFIYGMVTAIPFIGVGFIAAWRQLRAPSAARVAETLQAAVSMSWRDFSGAMENAFQRDGYQVMRLQGPAADFEIVKLGKTMLVSCKRWKAANTGVDPLRELYAAMEAQSCGGMYVATGKLTDNARRFAIDHRIHVIEGTELAQLLHAIKPPKA